MLHSLLLIGCFLLFCDPNFIFEKHKYAQHTHTHTHRDTDTDTHTHRGKCKSVCFPPGKRASMMLTTILVFAMSFVGHGAGEYTSKRIT